MHSFDGSGFAVGLAACAVAVAVLLGATFAVARRLGRHSVVDVAWGLGFVVVALVSLAVSGDSGNPDRRWLITVMVVLWGARLAWHIGWRNAGHGEDPRYASMLAKVPEEQRTAYALRRIYGLQGLLLLFISLPVQVAQYYRSFDSVAVHFNVPFGARLHGFGISAQENGPGWLAALGVLLWAVGLFFEAVGDRQLQAFKADPANRGAIMDRGLWRYTRHPNYFGDACVWWGIWLVAAETRPGVFTVLSPIAMTLLLTKGSGAALTERRMAGRPGFDAYVARTSPFLPWPPRRG